MAMEPLGLVLVPEPTIGNRIVEYAQTVLPVVGPVRSVLGEGAVPHVSFVHIRSEVPAEKVWEQVRIVDRNVEIMPIGIRFHPYNSAYLSPDESGRGVATFLQVLLDEALRRVREQAKATTWFSEGDITYPSDDAFDPHFTLGSTQPTVDLTVKGPVTLPDDLIGQRIPMRLALGPIGPFGVLQQVLYGGW